MLKILQNLRLSSVTNEKQIAWLKKLGVEVKERLSKTEASKLIEENK